MVAQASTTIQGMDPRAFAAQNAAGPVIPCSASGSSTGGDNPVTENAVPVTLVTTPSPTYALKFATAGDAAYDITPNAALTLTLDGGTPGVLQKVTLLLRQPLSGGYAIILPSARYPSGEAPTVSTVAGQVTILTFLTSDGGTTIYGGV